jgi:hypothetical protein
MKQKRYAEEQIIGAIEQLEPGIMVDEICRQMNISSGTFHKLAQ